MDKEYSTGRTGLNDFVRSINLYSSSKDKTNRKRALANIILENLLRRG